MPAGFGKAVEARAGKLADVNRCGRQRPEPGPSLPMSADFGPAVEPRAGQAGRDETAAASAAARRPLAGCGGRSASRLRAVTAGSAAAGLPAADPAAAGTAGSGPSQDSGRMAQQPE